MLKRLTLYITTKKHLAIGLCYFFLSVLFAFWITRLPEIKQNLNLSEADLGIALFFPPVGSIISMMLTARLIQKIGEGKTAVIAVTIFSLLAVLPVLAVNYFQLCFYLFFLGFTMGWVDVSINAVVNTIEKFEKVNIMSTSHGFFSLGGIVGGSIGGLIAGITVPEALSSYNIHEGNAAFPSWLQILVTGIILAIITMTFVRRQIVNLHDHDNKAEAPLFALPSKPVFVFALIGFSVLTAEGAITDWSTIYLRDFLGSSTAVAGFGFAAFSLTMTLGRFGGDYLIHRFGGRTIVFIGSILGIAGLLLQLTETIAGSISGFALTGLGYSCVVPVIFSQSARVKGINPATGLASVATAGYFGFLIGPVIMGLIAESFGLNNSFIFLLFLTVVTLFGSLRIKS